MLTDKNLSVKLADFGLAKIIGEESFTTTLCGTPSYVAPEILENSRHRKYTRAVDVWSLGVVLYICLCGFPPFSDELYTKQNPYTLAQQIKMGRFDYPSPYWDSVGDLALDLIDRMLTVDVEKRITIDECLEHPWIKGADTINPADSTDGLTGKMDQLDFSKRKPVRERTLLSNINDVKVTEVVEPGPNKVRPEGRGGKPSQMISDAPGLEATYVKVYEKNPKGKLKPRVHNPPGKAREERPMDQRDPEEFMAMGGKGDDALFGDDESSRYAPSEVPQVNGRR